MATDWTNPQLISQYSESGAENIHIRWDDSNGFAGIRSANGTSVGTVGSLFRIARSPKPDLTSKTYFLKCTGYNFMNLPNVITGIELQLSSKRSGRVSDDTISLIYDNNLIGNNQAKDRLDPIVIYGAETNLWGMNAIDRATVQNSSFGVVLRFRNHPNWPHRDPIDLISVQLRIH